MYEAKRARRARARGASARPDRADRRAMPASSSRALRAALDAARRALASPTSPSPGPDGRLARAEALARWTSPELGPVPPDRFIAVAEQAGPHRRARARLLRLVCDDLAAPSRPPGEPQHLAPPADGARLHPGPRGRARGAGHRPSPASRSSSPRRSWSTTPASRPSGLEELHAAGFSTALDDFGTGYSSIGYLRQMGFDTLKIDRSFVSGCCRRSDQGSRVVNGMILMAHGLGLRVVCEGVETAEELDHAARARLRPRPGLPPRPAPADRHGPGPLAAPGRVRRRLTKGPRAPWCRRMRKGQAAFPPLPSPRWCNLVLGSFAGPWGRGRRGTPRQRWETQPPPAERRVRPRCCCCGAAPCAGAASARRACPRPQGTAGRAWAGRRGALAAAGRPCGAATALVAPGPRRLARGLGLARASPPRARPRPPGSWPSSPSRCPEARPSRRASRSAIAVPSAPARAVRPMRWT